MRKALGWVFIGAMLILIVRMVSAQASIAMTNQCSPAVVEWMKDSVKVESFGCVDFRKDSLIIIPHLINGASYGSTLVLKVWVKKRGEIPSP